MRSAPRIVGSAAAAASSRGGHAPVMPGRVSRRNTPSASTSFSLGIGFGPCSHASPHNSGLHRFAVLTAVATLGLLGAGGLVTSHGAGMAVPDWPNTYGYNMFFFPVSQWVGGIFYEHTHRLAASGVGLLTVVLALWLYGRKRPPGHALGWLAPAPARSGDSGGCAAPLGGWIGPRADRPGCLRRKLDLAALRAEPEMAAPVRAWPRSSPSSCKGCSAGCAWCLLKDALGIFHATLAQLFFVLICAIALFTSRWWQTPARPPSLNSQLSTLNSLPPHDPADPGPIDPGRGDAASARRPGHS